MNLTCNSTLEDLRILPTSEKQIAGPLTFHDLMLVIGGSSTIIAIIMSLFLIFMHAIHYTKPDEQRHIIRILFMVPIYATASFLSIKYYWHAIYFQVLSDCYEAFAISSFFALLCAYIRPELHEQKNYFRDLRVIVPWVWPVTWFKKACGGDRGPWRTPVSGLTWFNIIWIGIYHYCFIRVAMTVTAVVTQYYGRYCESSNSPVFSHIWVLIIESLAVTIAMYCVIQFYVQLRNPLAEHQPFLKVLAIKLVIFLSFWQSTAISVGTSTLHLVSANEVVAYPDIKIGIPSMLLCVEMACFAFLHLWAFPYRPYMDDARTAFYPVADPDGPDSIPVANEHYPRSGGFMGLRALGDALNIWDVAKAFGRGVRWLFVGARHRREDISYQAPLKNAEMDLDDLSPSNFGNKGASNGNNGVMMGDNVDTSYRPNMLNSRSIRSGMSSTEHLPIATEFRRSRFVTLGGGGGGGNGGGGSSGSGGGSSGTPHGTRRNYPRQESDEAAGLIAYAQPMSASTGVMARSDSGRTLSTAGGSSAASSPERYNSPQQNYSQQQRQRPQRPQRPPSEQLPQQMPQELQQQHVILQQALQRPQQVHSPLEQQQPPNWGR